jgi:hypothetical protein
MLDSKKDIKTHLYDKGLKPPSHKEQWNMWDRPPLQMGTITYNDETAPWSRSNHLMGTRLLPSSDDRDTFSGISLGTLGLR